MAIMRSDGRENDELRQVNIITNFIPTASGSVLIECGRTRVICTVSLQERTADFLAGTGRGWLSAEYSMLPASTPGRKQRERTRADSRSLEIQRLIGRSLRSVVDTDCLGERSVWIDCDVIEADGGTRTASITGAYIALCCAAEKWLKQGIIECNPVKDSIAAVSVGIIGDQLVLDLCYSEDSCAQVDMNVVMTGSDSFVEIQGTGEQRAYSKTELDTLLLLAQKGIKELGRKQMQAIEAYRRSMA